MFSFKDNEIANVYSETCALAITRLMQYVNMLFLMNWVNSRLSINSQSPEKEYSAMQAYIYCILAKKVRK